MVEHDKTPTELTSLASNKPNAPAPQAQPEPQPAVEIIKNYFEEPKEEDVPKLGE